MSPTQQCKHTKGQKSCIAYQKYNIKYAILTVKQMLHMSSNSVIESMLRHCAQLEHSTSQIQTLSPCVHGPVRCQTYRYLPSCKASPTFNHYQTILLGDKMCEQLAQGQYMTGTCNLLKTVELLHKTVTHLLTDSVNV